MGTQIEETVAWSFYFRLGITLITENVGR